MKERPVLFSAPMVRAILDGTKTQTRRIMKPQLEIVNVEGLFQSWALPMKGNRHLLYPNAKQQVLDKCPYGKPGDRLWVRESWQCLLEAHNCKVGYAATPDNWKNIDLEMLTQEQDEQAWHWAKKVGCAPSIHMPRWASRILLEILGVRVERLNDISEQDAKAEGLKAISKDGETIKYGIPDRDGLPGNDDLGWSWTDWKSSPVKAYSQLWERINGNGSWDENPWVWVVDFKRIEPGAA